MSKSFPALLAKYGLGPDAPAAAAADKPAVIEKAAVVVAQAARPPPRRVARRPAAAPAPAASAPTQTASLDAGGKDPGKPAGDGTGEFDIAPKAPAATPNSSPRARRCSTAPAPIATAPTREQSVKKIDLRRLTLRYGDGAHNMFWKTVHEGRPTKGMPTWKGVFTDEQFIEIFAFLSSIQSTRVVGPVRNGRHTPHCRFAQEGADRSAMEATQRVVTMGRKQSRCPIAIESRSPSQETKEEGDDHETFVVAIRRRGDGLGGSAGGARATPA